MGLVMSESLVEWETRSRLPTEGLLGSLNTATDQASEVLKAKSSSKECHANVVKNFLPNRII